MAGGTHLYQTDNHNSIIKQSQVATILQNKKKIISSWTYFSQESSESLKKYYELFTCQYLETL